MSEVEALKKEIEAANRRIASLERSSRINYTAIKLLQIAGYVEEDSVRQAMELAEGAEVTK